MEKGKIRINTENIFPIIKKAVYSDHEIFLRELVSNSVDAISKRRMVSIAGECENSEAPQVNILIDREKNISKSGPDAVLFKQDEEKELFDKINDIRKAFTYKERKESYENHLKLLSDAKLSTDKFFDNVKVNDENNDIKNNRLELLQRLCSTFNTFIDFSKLEGN